MPETYFIADLHLGHAGVLKHDERPFKTIGEHDDHILKHLAALPQSSELWVLGDVAFNKEALERFFAATTHLQVCLIRGNHDDSYAWKKRQQFHQAAESLYIKRSVQGVPVKLYLSHYAHRVWRNSCHGSLHLHGHSHGALLPVGRSMDVGANRLDYAPISLTQVYTRLSDLPTVHHHERQRVIPAFISQMEKELEANQHKGDWSLWQPTREEAVRELSHHQNKLVAAVQAGDADLVSEYTADVANLAMKISTEFGLNGQQVPKITLS